MTTYSIDIKNESGKTLLSGLGSLPVARAVYGDLKNLNVTEDIHVKFIKVTDTGEDETITSLTADKFSVQTIVGTRLTELRKTDPDVPARRPRKSKGATEDEAPVLVDEAPAEQY